MSCHTSRFLASLLIALGLLVASAQLVAGAEGLEEVAKEAEHMAEDVAQARTAPANEARALAKEIADHAQEAEEALEAAARSAPASAKGTIDAAIAGAQRVNATAQSVQRASDADVRVRLNELDVAVQAFLPQLRAAVQAVRPVAGTLPRTGGLPAPLTTSGLLLAGLAMATSGAWLARRATR